MPKREAVPLKRSRKSRAKTPEEREAELIDLAFDAAEQRIREGRATGAEIVYLMKCGGSREKAERELMEKKTRYEEAKTSNLASQQNSEKLYEDALRAFRKYSGTYEEEDYDDDDYD